MYTHEAFENYPEYERVSSEYRQVLSELQLDMGESPEEMELYAIREEAYQSTSTRVKSRFGADSREYAASLFFLANWYQAVYSYKAFTYWLELLRLERKIFGAFNEEVQNTLNNIGLALLHFQEPNLSECFFRYNIALGDKFGNKEKGYEKIQLAHALHLFGDNERSIPYLKKAVDMTTTPQERGQLLLHLALDYGRNGDRANSETYFKESINIFREQNDPHHLAVALSRFGSFLQETDRDTEARKYYIECCEIELSEFEKKPDDGENVRETMLDILMLSVRDKDPKILLEWTARLIEHQEKFPSEEEILTANLMDIFSDLETEYSRLGTPESRLNYFKLLVEKFPRVETILFAARAARAMQSLEEADLYYRKIFTALDLTKIPPAFLEETLEEYMLFLVDNNNLDAAGEIAQQLGVGVMNLLVRSSDKTLMDTPGSLDELLEKMLDALPSYEED